MSTPTIDRLNGLQQRAETLASNASEAAAANGAQMKAVLEQHTVSKGITARMAALPKAAAAKLKAALTTFKLDAAAGGVAAAFRNLMRIAGRLLGKLGQIGYGTLAGAILTAGELRRPAVTAVFKVYKIVTAPVRLLGRVLRKVGLGKFVDWVAGKVTKAETWVLGKVGKALDWMDKHEHSGAMRWGRTVFQATFIQRALRLVFPWASGTWVFIASLFVPSFGAKKIKAVESPAEEAAIKRAADKLRDAGKAVASVPTAKVVDTSKADAAKAKVDAQASASSTSVQMVREIATGSIFEVMDGTITVDGKVVSVDALPEGFELGQVIANANGEEAREIAAYLEEIKRTEEAVRAAAATAGSSAPSGSRDNRRAPNGKRK